MSMTILELLITPVIITLPAESKTVYSLNTSSSPLIVKKSFEGFGKICMF